MKYFTLIGLLCLIVVALASNEANVLIKDYTGVILSSNLPSTFTSVSYSDITAKCIGVSPSSSQTITPVNNVYTRAKGSLTIISPVTLPSFSPNMKIVSKSRILTPRSFVTQTVTGRDQCLLGSSSLIDSLSQQDHKSLIVSFSGDEYFADALCSHYPTTTPTPERAIANSACVTLDGFLPISSPKFSDEASNSAGAQLLHPLRRPRNFSDLIAAFPQFSITVGTQASIVSISGTEYALEDVNVLLRELQYMHYVSSKLITFSALLDDNSPDLFSFTISGLNNKSASTGAILQLSEAVIESTLANYAQFYENSLITHVIQVPQLTTVAADDTTICRDPNTLGQEDPDDDDDDDDPVDPDDPDPTPDPTPDPDPVPDSGMPSIEEIRTYQIVLWLILGLVGICVAAFGATMTMHIQPDNQLMGGAQTSWASAR